MPSPAERPRLVEHALRAIAVLAIAALLWRALAPGAPAAAERAAGDGVRAALARWTVAPPRAATLALDSIPAPEARDWIAALARAGTQVDWRAGRAMGPGAVAVSPIPDPAAGALVSVVAPHAARVPIADDVGPLDTLPPAGAATRRVAAEVQGRATARVGGGTASAAPRDSLLLRRVLVLGGAGWESKFAIAALEERGWMVDARVRVAPGVEVTQGGRAVPDTARHAAVVALDTTAADVAAAIVRYVRAGGGLVVAGDAADIAALAPLLPGRAGPAVAGRPITAKDTVPRAALGARPIVRLTSDAVPLERRDANVMVAARRVGRGRVAQVGFTESWRWRLAGGGDPVAAHRAWWAGVVSAVAHAPAVALPAVETEPAPWASLVAALGAPSTAAEETAPATSRFPWTAVLFGTTMLALLTEVALRRVRGAG